MANSVDPDQTAPIGAVCSGPTLFASILNSSVMLGNYLQQTTSAYDIFRCIFLGTLTVNLVDKKANSILLSKYLLIWTFKLQSLTIKAPITTKVICFCHLLKCCRGLSSKQCRPRSDWSWSTLFVSILRFFEYISKKLQRTTLEDDLIRYISLLAF